MMKAHSGISSSIFAHISFQSDRIWEKHRLMLKGRLELSANAKNGGPFIIKPGLLVIIKYIDEVISY